MLSVVIPTRNSEGLLLPTLAALVPGAAAGIVSEVIVADAGSEDDTAAIADGAGCRILTSSDQRGRRLNAAARAARAGWLMFLRPGTVPDAGWIDEIRRFIEGMELRGMDAAATFRVGASDLRSTWRDAMALLRLTLGGTAGAEDGLVIARSLYDSLGGHRAVDEPERDLARRIGRRRLVLLRTGALMTRPAARVPP